MARRFSTSKYLAMPRRERFGDSSGFFFFGAKHAAVQCSADFTVGDALQVGSSQPISPHSSRHLDLFIRVIAGRATGASPTPSS